MPFGSALNLPLADLTLRVLLFWVNFLGFNLRFASRKPKHNHLQNKILGINRDFLGIKFRIFKNCISECSTNFPTASFSR